MCTQERDSLLCLDTAALPQFHSEQNWVLHRMELLEPLKEGSQMAPVIYKLNKDFPSQVKMGLLDTCGRDWLLVQEIHFLSSWAHSQTTFISPLAARWGHMHEFWSMACGKNHLCHLQARPINANLGTTLKRFWSCN